MAGEIRLEASEARVLGVLIEKELSTPDGYPLSLNALQAGCNQKSNRDPVMTMPEGLVFSAAERLRMQQLAGAVHPAGSRVEKFRHNARETLSVSNAELAILAELLLRGPQTPGELRTRASRMAPIETLEVLGGLLRGLVARRLVRDLPPSPGSRAPRVATTLFATSADPAPPAAPRAPFEPIPRAPSAPSASSAPAASTARVTPSTSHMERAEARPPHAPPATRAEPPAPLAALEARVARLEAKLASLAARLGEELE